MGVMSNQENTDDTDWPFFIPSNELEWLKPKETYSQSEAKEGCNRYACGIQCLPQNQNVILAEVFPGGGFIFT